MAAHARGGFALLGRMRSDNRLGQICMAFLTCLFGDVEIAFGDLNRLVESARGEIKRMPEPVRCLGGVLAKQAWRRMAIIAGRDSTMRRLQPAVVLFIHDVAIGARGGVIREIGSSFGVNKGVNAYARGEAD